MLCSGQRGHSSCGYTSGGSSEITVLLLYYTYKQCLPTSPTPPTANTSAVQNDVQLFLLIGRSEHKAQEQEQMIPDNAHDLYMQLSYVEFVNLNHSVFC